MRLLNILTQYLLITSVLPLAGQTFNNRYSFPEFEFGNGYSVEQSGDSLFIFSHFQDTIHKLGVHVLDFNGLEFGFKSFGYLDGYPYVGYSNTSDNWGDGFITAGSIDFGIDVSMGYMMKWNINADTILSNQFISYQGDSLLFFQQAKAVSDGFVAVGSTRDGIGTENIILLKTDFDLNEVWRRSYGTTTAPLAGYSVVQTPDGGFLLGGVRKVSNSWDHCVIKTDSEGIQQFIKYHGNAYDGNIAHVANTSDGKYIFGGMKQTGEFAYQSLICKLDTDLDTLWCKTYNTPGPDCFVNSIKLLDDGNLIVCGVDRSDGTMYGYILKIDSDGNELWYRKYAQTEDNWAFFYDVIQTTDGGYFLTGTLFPEVDMTQDIWGLKLDSLGCLVPGCDTADYVFSTKAGVGFSVYPNPTKQFVNVYISDSNIQQFKDSRFELVDMQGRVVKQFVPQLTDATYMLDVEDLPVGMYVLNMFVDEDIVQMTKIIKE